MTYDILAIGNAIVDVLAHVEDSFLETHGLTKGSMALIDQNQANTIYDAMPQTIEISGGSAANTAAGVAALGGKAAYIGKTNNDQLGEIFAHDLRSNNIHFTTKPAENGTDTARSFIAVTPDAQRTMSTFLGACRELTIDDVDESLIKASSVTYVEGYLWDEENAKKAITHAVSLVQSHGRKMALSLSDTFCVERHRSEFLTLIDGGVDILFANEEEALALCQTKTLDDASTILSRLCPLVVVTQGENGATVITPDDRITVNAQPVHVVDTTGAGDLFAAGFLHAYTQNNSLQDCALQGVASASEVITHLGARNEKKSV